MADDPLKAALLERAKRELAKRQAQPQERGIGQRLYDNIIGDPNDGVQSTGEALGTWLNRAGESATLGVVGDEASAAAYGALPGRSYEGELDRFRQNEENMSTAGRLSADLVGAIIPGAGIAGGVARAGGMGSRMLRGALGGIGAGATIGFAEGEGGGNERFSNALSGAGMGGLVGGAIPLVGGAVRSGLQSRAARNQISDAARGAPTSEALRAEGNQLYRQVDEAGVQIRPESFDRARGEIVENLRANTGFDELPGPGSLTPNAARSMQIMDQAGARMAQEPTAALPFRSLDQMRRQAGAAAGNVTNRADQSAGMEIIQGLDDFVQRLGPDDVAGGDVEALKSAITRAREVWGRMSRSQVIDDAIEGSNNYLGGGASGVRNQLARILRSPKLSRGFSDAERRALQSALRGGFIEQVIGLAGGGIGRIAGLAGGAATGGIPGAAVGAVGGQAARNASEAIAMRNIERVRAAIASGALRDPQVSNALITAGQRPEFLTNTGLSAINALAQR